jgi:hypothetical protein
MITLASGTRVWLAVGRTDMRKGFDGLSALVQQKLAQESAPKIHLPSSAPERHTPVARLPRLVT